MTRAVIADDHPLFLEALTAALEGAGVEVVGAVGNGSDVLESVAEHEPEAVLLDLEMPGMGGIECLKELRRSYPTVRVVIVSGHDDSPSIHEALDAGATCFIGKSVKPSDLAATVKAVIDAPAGIHFNATDPLVLRLDVEVAAVEPGGKKLTKRERQIVLLTADGCSNLQIATELTVTEQTVKFHLSNIFKKLGVANRTQAAAAVRGLSLDADSDESLTG
jgi:DNA-binding NarL/FixJ family response regulator